MADQVNVTSIDALDAFRASLIVFTMKARRCLDDARDDLRRTRLWLEHDQRVHWQREAAKRMKALNQAQQELMTAQLSKLHDAIQVRQAAVLKARRALEEAEAKRARVKAWSRDYESLADPLAKRLEGLRQALDHDMPKAIAYLVGALRALEGYSEATPPPDGEPAS